MKAVKITAVKQTEYSDLIQKYENPIEHACDIKIGDVFVSYDAQKPQNLCDSAWESMEKFVKIIFVLFNRHKQFCFVPDLLYSYICY